MISSLRSDLTVLSCAMRLLVMRFTTKPSELQVLDPVIELVVQDLE